MNPLLLKALLALLPVSMLVAGSIRVSLRRRSVSTFLQLAGAACLVVVVMTHVCETLHLFGWMQWGSADSPGHYLDLASAIGGVVLFPLGYLLDSGERRDQ